MKYSEMAQCTYVDYNGERCCKRCRGYEGDYSIARCALHKHCISEKFKCLKDGCEHMTASKYGYCNKHRYVHKLNKYIDENGNYIIARVDPHIDQVVIRSINGVLVKEQWQ